MSNSTTTAQERNLAEGGDGCCHKTRLKDAPCPVGWKCPYIKETPVSNTTTEKSEPAMPRWRAMTQLTRAVEKLTAEEIRELAVMAHLMKEKNSG